MDPVIDSRADDGDEKDLECQVCGGSGIIITCCDDLCQDGCIHGDGEEMCPACKGSGEES